MRSEIEQAVQLLQRGDDAALEQALALLRNTSFSFSMRVCGQRQDTEDTMQVVLLKSVPHLPKFDSPKALVVWTLLRWNWRNTSTFLASLEATIRDCRRLPSPSPDRIKAVRLRKEVMSRYERRWRRGSSERTNSSPACPAG